MSRKKSLIHMIAACEKTDFDKIVKAYLKEIYSYKHIVQTDGKDDCGLDIKVFDFSNQKIQYQMTVQKSDSVKGKKDLKEEYPNELMIDRLLDKGLIFEKENQEYDIIR